MASKKANIAHSTKHKPTYIKTRENAILHNAVHPYNIFSCIYVCYMLLVHKRKFMHHFILHKNINKKTSIIGKLSFMCKIEWANNAKTFLLHIFWFMFFSDTQSYLCIKRYKYRKKIYIFIIFAFCTSHKNIKINIYFIWYQYLGTLFCVYMVKYNILDT